MKINTLRFGMIEVDHNSLITFKDGLPGFSKLHLFFLVESAEDQLFMWLQSADDPRVAFPVIEPQFCAPSYKTPVTPEDMQYLETKDIKRVKVLCIVTIPEDPRQMTANLRAPILISLESQHAMQLISPESTYPVKFPIFGDLQRFVASQSDDSRTSARPSQVSHEEPQVRFHIHRLKEI